MGNRSSDNRPCSILSRFPTLDAAPQKYQNAGLRKDFKDVKAKKAEEAFDPFQSGGIDDEDAVSARPAFPQTQAPAPRARFQPEAGKDLKRDHTRKNDVGSSPFLMYMYLTNLPPACSCPARRK